MRRRRWAERTARGDAEIDRYFKRYLLRQSEAEERNGGTPPQQDDEPGDDDDDEQDAAESERDGDDDEEAAPSEDVRDGLLKRSRETNESDEEAEAEAALGREDEGSSVDARPAKRLREDGGADRGGSAARA